MIVAVVIAAVAVVFASLAFVRNLHEIWLEVRLSAFDDPLHWMKKRMI